MKKQKTKIPTQMIISSITTISNDEIKTLPQGIIIAPAQGDRKIIWPLAVICNLHIEGAYTGVTDASLAIKIGNNTSDVAFMSQGYLEATEGDYVFSVPIGPLAIATGSFSGILADTLGWNLPSVNNAPLKIVDDYIGLSNYAGGNPANTLKITVYYVVVDL